jgi:hypothetical protein
MIPMVGLTSILSSSNDVRRNNGGTVVNVDASDSWR